MGEKEAAFLNWLTLNGAKFPKLKWPSNETKSGIRGVVALESIDTNECMMEIPSHLMMCEPNFGIDSRIGQIIRDNESILPGDLPLCVFIMHEIGKDVESFYFPYLTIVPKQTDSILEWSIKDRNFLQVL